MILGEVWGIGKRNFAKDWSRRVWLFDKLVWTVMSYEDLGMERKREHGTTCVCV